MLLTSLDSSQPAGLENRDHEGHRHRDCETGSRVIEEKLWLVFAG